VCDGLPVRIARKGRTPNAQVGIRIDRDRFEDLLVDAYGRLP
jgi:inosine-uridine nucleoside N-ribohydrolase